MLPPLPDDDHAALQRALRASRDYVGPITGVLDESTTRAVRFFQARNGLDVSGVADALTRSLLGCPLRNVGARPPSETRPVVPGGTTVLVTAPPDTREVTAVPQGLPR